eukprot:TRINITY_DN5244_c0_g1_i4.p1 TRINITY_DN5244_c0_g1~~TRINITY_DN5244_c0_g1_i4.p1  ORF type:complete len:542 (+),score=165.72 TRINITY_DN5244_c0_g1_i4:756-2381(+)
MVSTFTANLFLQGFQLQIRDYGVLTFGLAQQSLYTYTELLPFVVMGVVGGLIGALFSHFNTKLNLWRSQYFVDKRKWLRLAEIAIIVVITTVISFGIPFLLPCRNEDDIMTRPSTCDIEDVAGVERFYCPEGYYNDMASLMFTSPDKALRLLYSRNKNVFSWVSLLLFGSLYLFLLTITSGVYIASGTFVPFMLVGASFGRLCGSILERYFSDTIDNSIYALIGSAAMMAGSLRLTISLVVILVELTEGTQYLLPIILAVMVGKWTADLFNDSVYEHLMEVKHIPFLNDKPSSKLTALSVKQRMGRDIVTLPEIVQVREVIRVLQENNHNGFPAIKTVTLSNPSTPNIPSSRSFSSSLDSHATEGASADEEANHHYARNSLNSDIDAPLPLRAMKSHAGSDADCTFDRHKLMSGLILRSQLIVMLKRRLMVDRDRILPDNMTTEDLVARNENNETYAVSHPDFTSDLSRKLPNIQDMVFYPEELDQYLDLRPFLNISVVTVKDSFSYVEAHKMFCGLGLRHIVVVNIFNEPVGILTRKDFL